MTKKPKGPLHGFAALSIAGVWALAIAGAVVLFLLWLLGIEYPR